MYTLTFQVRRVLLYFFNSSAGGVFFILNIWVLSRRMRELLPGDLAGNAKFVACKKRERRMMLKMLPLSCSHPLCRQSVLFPFDNKLTAGEVGRRVDSIFAGFWEAPRRFEAVDVEDALVVKVKCNTRLTGLSDLMFQNAFLNSRNIDVILLLLLGTEWSSQRDGWYRTDGMSRQLFFILSTR